MSKWYYLRKYVLNKILKMALQNLFIPSGMYFGVTDLPKKDNKNQKFSVNLNDNRPERIIEYTPYDTWVQTEGFPMLDSHLELLGRAIKINFKELFQ